jgi:YtkA-like
MRSLVLSLALGALAATACSGGNPPPDADEALACMTAGRGDTYAVGLEHDGSAAAYTFRLMSADPAPPGRNLNTWVVEITWEATGAPVTGATLVVTPFMPDHQHGAGAYIPQVEEMAAGQYKISQINTWMPGYWEITITASAAQVQDTVLYKFCIPA